MHGALPLYAQLDEQVRQVLVVFYGVEDEDGLPDALQNLDITDLVQQNMDRDGKFDAGAARQQLVGRALV